MKRNLLMLAFVVATASLSAGEPNVNPLMAGFNQNIEFNVLTPEHIKTSTDIIIEKSKTALSGIFAIPKEKRSFDNTMLAIDNMYNDYGKVSSNIYLMANAHPDKATREQALASLSVLDKFDNEIALDENLYRAVKEYSESPEAKKLQGFKKKYLEEILRDFERNGFALPKEKRDQLKTMQDRLSDLGITFGRNIAEAADTLFVTEEEMKGLPDDYKSARKMSDGRYRIDMTYPSYVPFMKYSQSESARKALYVKYNNRSVDKNLHVLRDLVGQRQEMATLLGYKTYGQYRVEDRMAKKPENVWSFESALIDKVKEKARRDYDELLAVKRNYLKDASASVINPWESSFYNGILMREKYSVDDEKIKEYFELNNVTEGLFKISQKLFDVEFSEIKNPSVWHGDVRMFEVRKKGKVIAHFYFDLFPRPNKYGHAACFGMVKGKSTPNGYQLPAATLECNFPAPSGDRPSLMYHSAGSASVETFFHEFGHVLHNILTTSELYSQSGTAVPRDFVEAPSQIFENWAWDYDVVKMFAKHYKTGEVLPKAMFDKMVAAKNVGSGIGALQQVFYGMVDFTLHEKWNPKGAETSTDIVKRLQNEITLFPYLEGTNFQASFGHLNGYGAGYYGYLWSEVYAADMFSVFEKNGVMDQKTGLRYRDIILARGGSEDPYALVKEFLGREPNQEAFLKSLGL